jgi:hypothetical protein
MIDIKKTETLTSHPLEEVLNIEPNTTAIQTIEVSGDMVEDGTYDEKEREIESDYQQIAEAALETYVKLQDEMDGTDKRAIARLAEVSATVLNTAISAINGKAKLKELKNKIDAKKNQSPTSVTNILQIDRNELVRKIKGEGGE